MLTASSADRIRQDSRYPRRDQHVVTVGTQTGGTTANLRFLDEFTRFADARGQIYTRKERLPRFLAVEIQVKLNNVKLN